MAAVLRAVLVALLLLTACDSVDPDDRPKGSLTVTAALITNPPALGDNELKLHVSDVTGTAVSDANISAEPWMPAMGHGVSFEPKCAHTNGGEYGCTGVYFSMPGTWEIRIEAATARAMGSLTLTYDIGK